MKNVGTDKKINPWLWFGSCTLALAVYFSSTFISPTPQVLGQQSKPLIETDCHKPQLCLNDFEKINSVLPSYKDAYIHQAYYHWLNQEIELAQENINKAKSLDPLNPYFDLLDTFLNN